MRNFFLSHDESDRRMSFDAASQTLLASLPTSHAIHCSLLPMPIKVRSKLL